MKPALLADWDLSHVLAQLNQAKHVYAETAAPESQGKSIFRENPDPANINEYHLGIADEAGHLEFKCGEFVVSHEGTSLRATGQIEMASGKDLPKLQLPEQWWCSSEAAVAAIKKVARQELEELLKKDRSKREEPKSLEYSLSSSATAAKKKPTLAAGSMTLGKLGLPRTP
jgi:hypothetical protein